MPIIRKRKSARRLEDQELIRLMQHDLMMGIGAAYEEYKKTLEYVAHNVLDEAPRLSHLAEDAVQDGFINAINNLVEHPEHLEDPEFRLRAWLTTIVRNQALSILKTGKAHIVLDVGVVGEEMEHAIEEGYIAHFNDDPSIIFEQAQERIQARRVVRQQLATLPPQQRTAVEQKYLVMPQTDGKEKSDVQTAKELKRPVKTVRSQLQRGLKQMREQIEQKTEHSIYPQGKEKTS